MYESELLDKLNDNYELKLWPFDGRWEAIITCYGYSFPNGKDTCADDVETAPAGEYRAVANYPYEAVKMAMAKAGFEVPDV